MKEIAVFDAKARLSELLTDVEQGEQYVITRRGVAVARLVGAVGVSAARRAATSQRLQVAATFAKLKVLRQGIVLDGNLKDLIAEGRD